MLADARLVGFVAVTDLGRAEQFYGGTLGLAVRESTPYALVVDGGGTEVRLTLVEQRAAAPYTVLGWQVSDIEATVDDLVARGVTFTRYDGMDQDDRGVWTAPGGDRIGWFTDPDGNVLSLQQPR